MKPSLALVSACAVVGLFAFAACGDDDATPTPSYGDGGADSSAPDSGAGTGTPTDGGGGDSGAGGDGGDAGSTGLGAGPYTLLYVATGAGIDQRSVPDGKATFDGVKLTAYEASADEKPTLGTAKVQEASGDAFALVGRWADGTTGGKFYNVGGNGLLVLPANAGFNYVIGTGADPVPSGGAAAYTLLHATAATLDDGSVAPGTLTGSLAANLAGASTKIGFSLTLTVNGIAYSTSTTGGVANTATSESTLIVDVFKGGFFANDLAVSAASGPCVTPGACKAATRGVIAGANGERIGVVASLSVGNGLLRAIGAAVFQK